MHNSGSKVSDRYEKIETEDVVLPNEGHTGEEDQNRVQVIDFDDEAFRIS